MHPDTPHKKRPLEDGEQDDQVDGVLQAEQPARKKKNAHRGTRSESAKQKRLQKYIESGGPERARKVINNLTGKNSQFNKARPLITLSETHHPLQYPDEFLHTRKDQQMVRDTIIREFPDAANHENLPIVPSLPGGILRIPTPAPTLALDSDHPPYLMLRLVTIVSKRKQLELLAAWDRLKATSPRHYIKSEEARSATPAYHFGIWEVTARAPYITRESKDQTAEAVVAIDNLLGLVKEQVVPKIISMMKEYLPVQWKHQERWVNMKSPPSQPAKYL